MISLKYDNFRYYWAAVTEEKTSTQGIVPLRWDS